MKKYLSVFFMAVAMLFVSCVISNTKELKIPDVPTDNSEKVQWTVEKAKLHWTVSSTGPNQTADFKKENANSLEVELDLKTNQKLQFNQSMAKQLADSYAVYLLANGDNIASLDFDNHSKDELVRFLTGQTNQCHVSASTGKEKNAAELFDQAESFMIWLDE